MAIEKTIELNVNATQATKALDKFGGTLEDVYGEGVQPLNFAIGELEDRLYEMAAAGNTGTKEFKEMAAEVGRMKKVIIDVDLAVDGLAMTTSQQLSGSMMGVASGFELAQGAMGAFGAESEAVEAALLKVQSASAIADGLQGIKESVASFKALKNSIMATTVVQKAAAVAGKIFNAVLKANPIGLIITAIAALVTGIVALINNFRAVTDWLGITSSESQKAHEQMIKDSEALREARQKAFNKDQENMDLEIKRRKALGEDTYQIELKNHKERVKFAKEQMKLMIAELKMKKALGQVDEEVYNQFVEQGGAMLEMFKSSNEAIIVMEAEHQKQLADKRKAAYEKNKAEKDKETEQEKARLAKEYADKLKAEQDAEAMRQEWLDAIAMAEYEATVSAQQKEIDAVTDKYFELIERAKQYGQDTAILEEEQAKQIADIEDRYRKEKEEKEEEARQKQKEADEKALQDRLDREQKSVAMASSALDAINGLVQAFAGDNEKAQKRAFAIDKAVNIAKAVMNTATGVSQALASAPPPLSFVNAGIAASVGAAQIATIAKTQFQGGSTSASAPSIPSGGGARPATFNVVGNSGTNQLAETLSSSPMKAYVVGSDVTTQQSLDRNRVRNASM